MSTEQAGYFDALAMLVASRETKGTEAARINHAYALVEAIAVKLLSGEEPEKKDAPWMKKMSLLFKPLSGREIDELPQEGCPAGQVNAIVIMITQRNKDAFPVRVTFNAAQRKWYNKALTRIAEAEHLTRDDAWRRLNNMVAGNLLGEKITMQSSALFVECRDVFPPVAPSEVEFRLPKATEMDIASLCFRKP